MNGEFLFDSLEFVDAELIEAAGAPARRKRTGPWVRWTAAAACLCLILGGAFAARSYQSAENHDLPAASLQPAVSFQEVWTEDTAAADYFKNNRDPGGAWSGSGASLAYPPYAAEVSISDRQAALEAEGAIPALEDHPEHAFSVYFNGDGSLYKVVFFWMRRGGPQDYSDLKVSVAPRELREYGDVISIVTDGDGNVIDPIVTVTERDRVLIIAAGNENTSKTLYWQNASGWYQIEGSRNDSYEDVVALLDWFWEHPVDLGSYARLGEDIFTETTLAERPDAFAGAIPDFPALGYANVSDRLYLTEKHVWYGLDGELPVYFEGEYVRGETRVRWEVGVTSDGYDTGKTAGWAHRVMEADVAAVLEDNDRSVQLDYRGEDRNCRITLTLLDAATAADAWELIQTLQ